jgi:hypothetical protein
LWLLDARLPDDLSPRRTHVVFDSLAETVTVEGRQLSVLTAWCDAMYPNAWRAPKVMRAMNELSRKHRMPWLVRVGPRAFFAVTPSINAGAWHIQESAAQSESELATRFRERAAPAVEAQPSRLYRWKHEMRDILNAKTGELEATPEMVEAGMAFPHRLLGSADGDSGRAGCRIRWHCRGARHVRRG